MMVIRPDPYPKRRHHLFAQRGPAGVPGLAEGACGVPVPAVVTDTGCLPRTMMGGSFQGRRTPSNCMFASHLMHVVAYARLRLQPKLT